MGKFCHKCDKELDHEDYYCEECADYLNTQKQKPKETQNKAKAIHDFMFK